MATSDYLFVEGQVLPAAPGDMLPDARMAEIARRLPRKVKKSVTQAQFTLSEDATNIARVDAAGALLVPSGTIYEFPVETVVAPTPEDVVDAIPVNEVELTCIAPQSFLTQLAHVVVTPIANYQSVSSLEAVDATNAKIRIHGQTGTVSVKVHLLNPSAVVSGSAAAVIDSTISPVSVTKPDLEKSGETIPVKSITLTLANSALDAGTFYWGHSYAAPADAFDNMSFEVLDTQQIAFHFRNLTESVELHAIGFQPATPETESV